jgi:hypothetical protein
MCQNILKQMGELPHRSVYTDIPVAERLPKEVSYTLYCSKCKVWMTVTLALSEIVMVRIPIADKHKRWVVDGTYGSYIFNNVRSLVQA